MSRDALADRTPASNADARELPDPGEAAAPIPWLFLAFALGTVGFGTGYLLMFADDERWVAGDSRSAQVAASTEVSGPALFQRCAPCHQANGMGVPGVFPPLAGSPWVLEDPETLTRILLVGVHGDIEVGGQHYNGTMPSFASFTDEELAAVASHVRASFGNDAEPIDAALVEGVRAALGARATPWEGGAELDAARGPR